MNKEDQKERLEGTTMTEQSRNVELTDNEILLIRAVITDIDSSAGEELQQIADALDKKLAEYIDMGKDTPERILIRRICKDKRLTDNV